MNLTPFTLIVAALATWEIIEIWQHSSLLAGWRAITETWNNFFGRVLHCMFCLTPWISWLVCLIMIVPVPPWDGSFANVAVQVVTLAQFIVCGFAIARLANIGNDLTHDKCRTPNRDMSAEVISQALMADLAKESIEADTELLEPNFDYRRQHTND